MGFIVNFNISDYDKITRESPTDSRTDALGEFAPEFAHLNDNILFGEVWSRNDLLSLRDRSIVTVVALMSQGLTDSRSSIILNRPRRTGVTKT